MAEDILGISNPRPRLMPRLLIVEDDPVIRNFCRLLLQQQYTVETAEHGRAGLERLRREPFDLVLTDLQMPEMDGLELLHQLRKDGMDVDVIILTAHATVETARQTLKMGAADYLSKPFDADDLEHVVRTCLELRRMRQEKERLSDLVVMYQFSQLIAASLDTEAQIQHISEFLWQRFQPATLSISIIYPEEGYLSLLTQKLRAGEVRAADPVTLQAGCDEEGLAAAHLQLIDATSLPERALIFGTALRTYDRAVGYLHLTRAADQAPFDTSERRLLSVFASQIAASLDNARLYQELRMLNWQTIEALAEAIDARDTYTYGHSRQVTRYAVRLAEILGLPTERIDLLRYAGLLHDIGKIGIHDYILLKPGALSAEEYEIMKKHPTIGARILNKVHGLRAAIPIVEAHHERMDGNGYPNGLSGDQLPLEARILAIADTFEAMTANRAYRAALDIEQALQVLIKGKGTKWDAQLVDVFVELIRAEGDRLMPAQLSQVQVPLIYPGMEKMRTVGEG